MHNDWIPVEEMLPEHHEKYQGKKRISILVSTQGGMVYSCNRELVQWRDGDPYWRWGSVSSVVAWMPLPKAYKVLKK